MAAHAESVMTDLRAERRDDVHRHVRAVSPDGAPVSLLVVNLSPHGLMARCDVECSMGRHLRVSLPLVGEVSAEVRWSLGGRIGCRIAPAIDPVDYGQVLAAMR